ncbi:tyrosine-type recombinase/integrase [Aldersonia kunmingensis]|uniref:tyrosine-type recombinase/integrase n=1 Tax=Aldersonia kunmingensis TaxID=408066 RepID=UPI000B2FC60A|nr:site-specific integrase [Aldersonia kunmingensis]
MRYPASITFTDELDADAWLAEQRRAIRTGRWVSPEEQPFTVATMPTLSTYADTWITERPIKESTRSHYRALLRNHIDPVLGRRRVDLLDAAAVRSWYSKLDTGTPTARAHAYSLLHAILRTATEDGLLEANPAKIKKAMRTERKRDVVLLGPAEIAKLADAMPQQYRLAVLLASWGGLRWGEVSELRRRDIDGTLIRVRRAVRYQHSKFTVSSTKSFAGRRDVHLPSFLSAEMERHLREHTGPDDDALLFTDEGGQLPHHRFDPIFAKAKRSIGKPDLRFHDLRHSGATLAAQSGYTVKELMERLGHSSPVMAMKYQHAAEERGKELAERLGALAKKPRKSRTTK